jgi:hypothetical protein
VDAAGDAAARQAARLRFSPVGKTDAVTYRQTQSGSMTKAIVLGIWLAAPVLAAASIGSAAQTNPVFAVEPGGPGKLTKHMEWLVTSSRRTYHHIRLPARIAIGDTITLSFGSNTKTYGFSVARITLKGNHCEIFSRTEVHHRPDKIDVTPCYLADSGGAAR